MRWYISLTTLGICLNQAAYATPGWALKNTQELTGQTLRLVCNGTGASVSLARSDALNSCRASASEHLASEVKIHTLTVETEHDSGVHHVVDSDVVVKNLVCVPEKEEIETTGSSFSLWIKCRFDLRSAQAKSVDKPELVDSTNYSKVAVRGSASVSAGVHRVQRSLFLSSIPPCDSVVFTGVMARKIKCTANPMALILEPEDHEAIVRSEGYRPKTITIPEGDENEDIQVVLDP